MIQEKNALFGIGKILIIIIIFVFIVGMITIYKYPLTGKLINAIKGKNGMGENTKVELETSYGNIVIELYESEAPVTCSNFISYVNEGFYNGLVFHRVIKGFMIQGGGYDEDGNEKETHNPIKLESDNGLKNERYTVAMARTSVPDSATSQFFINTANNEFLNRGARDEGYAVFGKVVEGMDIVNKIESAKTGVKHGMQDWPIEDAVIIKTRVI